MKTADCKGVNGFLVDGACLLVDGTLQANGTFLAHTIADPPMEPRQQAIESLHGLELSGAKKLRCSLKYDFRIQMAYMAMLVDYMHIENCLCTILKSSALAVPKFFTRLGHNDTKLKRRG
jgi:hypothetical protein